MSFKVELCEATDITAPVDMDRKFTEEVDDGRRTIGQREPQDEGGEYYRE